MEPTSCTVGVAARQGDLRLLKQLIADGYEVDVKDTRGWRATHEAAAGNHIECLQCLIQQDVVDVSWESFEGVTALLVACQHGNVDCARLLLEHGADPNRADAFHTCPLLAATQADSVACVQLLLKYKANVDAQSYCGTTALHQASSRGLVAITHQLLEEGARLDTHDECEITPVFVAAQYGQQECLKIMLQKAQTQGCPDVVNMATEDGGTPLYLSAQEGHVSCLELLLANGADANLMTQAPKALPLHAALQFGHTRCIRKLFPLTRESSLSQCDPNVFDFAFQHSDTKYTGLLLRMGANVHQRHRLMSDDEFEPKVLRYAQHTVRYSRRVSALAWLAVLDYDISHARLLLDGGAIPNPTHRLEVPPLLAALNNRQLELCELMVSHGASVNLYHPHIQGNMCLIVCLVYWRGLNLMLHCGAEADSLFRTPHTTSAGSEDNSDCAAPSEDDGYPSSEDELEMRERHSRPPLDLYELLMAARYILSRMHVSTAQILSLLLYFTSNVQLDPRIESLLDTPNQWSQLRQITDQPRSLMHYCRHVIRQSLGSKELINWKNIPSLPLPQPILDFLLYKELNDVVAR